MADYQLTANEVVIRTEDGAFIPNDPNNKDRIEYEEWLENGGIPDPYVPPKLEIELLSTDEVVFYNHENRLRALEGKEPITIKQIVEIRKQMRDDVE